MVDTQEVKPNRIRVSHVGPEPFTVEFYDDSYVDALRQSVAHLQAELAEIKRALDSAGAYDAPESWQRIASLDDERRRCIDSAEAAERTVQRYERLRILGCAPYGSPLLERGLVLRFTGLDKFIDEDIAAHQSRGET